MKLIVGLGNPGRGYAETRHNVGWWVVDHLADVWHFDGWRKSLKAEVSRGQLAETEIRLLKPQTFMNLSGEALIPYLNDERLVPSQDLLIVVDDVALPVGRLRLREEGSSGGHNGLESIEAALGSRKYARLRVGVGPALDDRRSGDLADYVLDRMGKREREEIRARLPEVVDGIEIWVREGAPKAMSRLNRKGSEEEDSGQPTEDGGRKTED